MKKALSLLLALVMALSLTVPAFAEEPDNSTDITLTVAKALTYDMVIPEDVTDLANYGIYEVGQAKVANVKNATEKTVITYTAETADFESEGKTDIPASYYTDAQGAAAFPTTAVEVYKNNADVASLPTMYVGISESAWDAAENGTYTATVTFNFTAEEVLATVADVLATVPGGFPVGEYIGWRTDNLRISEMAYIDGDALRTEGNNTIPLTTAVTKTGDSKYTAVLNVSDEWSISTRTFVFTMNGGVLTEIYVKHEEQYLEGGQPMHDPLIEEYTFHAPAVS